MSDLVAQIGRLQPVLQRVTDLKQGVSFVDQLRMVHLPLMAVLGWDVNDLRECRLNWTYPKISGRNLAWHPHFAPVMDAAFFLNQPFFKFNLAMIFYREPLGVHHAYPKDKAPERTWLDARLDEAAFAGFSAAIVITDHTYTVYRLGSETPSVHYQFSVDLLASAKDVADALYVLTPSVLATGIFERAHRYNLKTVGVESALRQFLNSDSAVRAIRKIYDIPPSHIRAILDGMNASFTFPSILPHCPTSDDVVEPEVGVPGIAPTNEIAPLPATDQVAAFESGDQSGGQTRREITFDRR